MKINSAKEYRTQVKKTNFRPDVDEDFMGCSYNTTDGHKCGFFNLFHGMKDNIERYLSSLLDIAEDNQAIYEFLQNAVDCNATHFWAFYNDQYFLAINNGTKFSIEGLTSILNIAQSIKTDSSSIGRLGIGFKLAHRLVGKGNGVHELLHSSKGPIMFSWDKPSQLRELMSSEEITYGGLEENAFLLKIAITNFPANAGEVVKDINYKDVVAFPESELKELRKYVTECLDTLFESNRDAFNQGTLFFIKLGENKRQLLDNDLATLKNGIEYSMNTLKQLNNICFNGEVIYKKKLHLFESSIAKDSSLFNQIEPLYNDYDILYTFGFLPLAFDEKGYYEQVNQLRHSPNFYKYFPMGDEVDSMALFIHSDSFQVEANRRKLINEHTNIKLLPEIASFIDMKLHEFMLNDYEKFLQLYASILLTDKPLAQEKAWMNSVFFDQLFASIKTCVPISGGTCDTVELVKINKTNLDIPLHKIGHDDKMWFRWKGDDNKELLAEARKPDKLGLEEWNINDIIVNADKTKLNAWLDSCEECVFDAFVNEIRVTTTSNDAKEILPSVKLYKLGAERKSQNEIDADGWSVIITAKTAVIKDVLQKVGMKCTDVAFESHSLSSLLSVPSEKDVFLKIKKVVEDNVELLDTSDKLALVTAFSTFENLPDDGIRQLRIFKNRKGKTSSFAKLTAYDADAPYWLHTYVIAENENIEEFQSYLVSNDDVYTDIVCAEYNSIFNTNDSIDEIYSYFQKEGKPWNSVLTQNLIQKYGVIGGILSLLEKTLDKDSVEAFIYKVGTLRLCSDKTYDEASFEYRCIQLAAKVGATSVRSRITIDDIRLTYFASSDTLSFGVYEDGVKKQYTIKLSDVLPDDTQSAIYGKIVSQFSAITDYTTIFSADSTNVIHVTSRLQVILKPEGASVTPAQFVYILLTRAAGNYSSLGFWGNIVGIQTPEQVAGIISYCYDNGLMPILLRYKTAYFLRSFFQDKYLFSSDYTLDKERACEALEDWCGTDANKKKALIELGMHFDDCAEIKRRMAFKNNTMTEWDGDIKRFPISFVNWVHSFAPVTQDNQIKVLNNISQKYKIKYAEKQFVIDDYADAIQLQTEKYIKWKEGSKISIYLLRTCMPYRIVYDSNDILCTGHEGDFHYFADKNRLYVKADDADDVANVLPHVYADDSVPFTFEDFSAICLDSIEEQKEKDDIIRKLQAQVEKYKNGQIDSENDEKEQNDIYLRNYSEIIADAIDTGFTMPEDKQKAENLIGRYRALKYITNRCPEFVLAPTFCEKEFVGSTCYKSIPLANGKVIHIQSAIYGIWHLSPLIWHSIVDDGNYECVCYGYGEDDFLMIRGEDDIKRIAELCPNVLMRMTATKSMDIMQTIKSVLDTDTINLTDDCTIQTYYDNRDVHLMLKVHQTPNSALNSIFDNVFNAEGNYDIL